MPADASIGPRPTRREFLTVALGTAGALAASSCMPMAEGPAMPRPAASLGPAETATLRISVPPICDPAFLLAESYLREEGITDVQYVKGDASQAMSGGAADLVSSFASGLAADVEAGNPVVALAGLHVGCIGLFAQKGIRSVGDLRGKTVFVGKKDPRDYRFAYFLVTFLEAGLDPFRDVNIVEAPGADFVQMFRDGKADAVLTATTGMDKLRAEGKFEMLVDYAMDAPWSGHQCCLLVATRSFYDMHPNAARRAVRAILRANIDTRTDLARGVRLMVDRGWTTDYDGVLAHDRMLPYDSWRTVDPEVGIRFFAERLQRTNVIKSSADEIVRKGTDWSALLQAKRELKA